MTDFWEGTGDLILKGKQALSLLGLDEGESVSEAPGAAQPQSRPPD